MGPIGWWIEAAGQAWAELIRLGRSAYVTPASSQNKQSPVPSSWKSRNPIQQCEWPEKWIFFSQPC